MFNEMSAKCNMTPASQLYLNSLVMWLSILYFTWGNNMLVIFNVGCALQKQKCPMLMKVSDRPQVI